MKSDMQVDSSTTNNVYKVVSVFFFLLHLCASFFFLLFTIWLFPSLLHIVLVFLLLPALWFAADRQTSAVFFLLFFFTTLSSASMVHLALVFDLLPTLWFAADEQTATVFFLCFFTTSSSASMVDLSLVFDSLPTLLSLAANPEPLALFLLKASALLLPPQLEVCFAVLFVLSSPAENKHSSVFLGFFLFFFFFFLGRLWLELSLWAPTVAGVASLSCTVMLGGLGFSRASMARSQMRKSSVTAAEARRSSSELRKGSTEIEQRVLLSEFDRHGLF